VVVEVVVEVVEVVVEVAGVVVEVAGVVVEVVEEVVEVAGVVETARRPRIGWSGPPRPADGCARIREYVGVR
jgi:hypothetical protein